mmetsp:Transcript_42394/g.68756  ORF Transcript_42394/g.68756 Transcript_42394/m.68756 type:complete len:660 (+) Transcript_42394:3-1982(+)
MFAEILLALLGHPGSVILQGKNSFVLSQDFPFLHESERELIQRCCGLGFYYQKIESFLHRHLLAPIKANVLGQKEQGEQLAVTTPGLYVRALCAGLEEILDEYRSAILACERRVLNDPSLSLNFLQHELQKYVVLFPALYSLVQAVESDAKSGGHILHALHSRAVCGHAFVQESMRRLQFFCHRVLYKFVAAWMVHGLLVDRYGEFFIQQCSTIEPSSTNQASDVPGSLLGAPVVSENAWNTQYTLRLAILPPYISVPVAEKVLFVGKAVRVLSDHPHNTKQQKAGNELLPASDVKDFNAVLRDLMLRPTFHSLSFEVAVESIRSVVARHLWQLVVVEADLPAHLKALKDYFLLARGEFYQVFIEELTQLVTKLDMASPVEFDIRVLFQQASLKSTAEDDDYFKRFNVRLQTAASQARSGSKTPAMDLWRGLYLEYRVDWPLHIMLHPTVFEKYNTLFRFLFSVKRVQMELQKAWAPQMQSKHLPASQRSKLFAIWRLRSQMAFVIDNLQYYMQVDVIDAQYTLMQQKIEQATDFEMVSRAHEEYLAALITQCFLHHRSNVIMRVLENIIESCYRFCGMVRNGYENMEMAEVAKMAKNFEWQACFLLALLMGVDEMYSSPHLSRFLLRLDYNHHFSLTADKMKLSVKAGESSSSAAANK